MKLPKDSKEKSIKLPHYLEFPRHFDIRREYLRYKELNELEKNDNSSTTFAPSTSLFLSQIDIPSIVNYLKIDFKSSSLQTSLSEEGKEEKFDISKPRRASEDVKIFSIITEKLIKDSERFENSGGVFKRPLDMDLDFQQFKLEKSKILYLTKLTMDTTQSELESWFTQFGGRPIAFWAIKQPQVIDNSHNNNNNSANEDNNSNSSSSAGLGSPTKTGISSSGQLTNEQNATATSSEISTQTSIGLNKPLVTQSKPTVSGFVIFSTHEEAIESLAMNGRILNDKIIEVQPSSMKILDKAQEVLTAFPSSKNRPRPGDWTCPSCGFSNFQRRTACFRCSFPAASAATIQESIYSNDSSANTATATNVNATINAKDNIDSPTTDN
ncbi:unnamed protein product [[Candida] boidinii]|nr:unnamed protein product [[Candida] boidinii]